MVYNKRKAKKKRDAQLCFALVGAIALFIGGMALMGRTAVRWELAEYKISNYKNAQAQTIGRTYPLEQQEALFVALKEAVDESYIKEVGGKKRTDYVLVTAFSETFSQDLVIEISMNPDGGKTWSRTFKREEVELGVVDFGEEIGLSLGQRRGQ